LPHDQTSSSSSCIDSSNNNSLPIHSLIEGSLEYREMKRLYVFEKQQAEDWRKDYKVLKRQLAHVKSTTIRKCSSSFNDKSNLGQTKNRMITIFMKRNLFIANTY